jgi:hypothetical protein
VFIQKKTHELLQKIFQYFFEKKRSKPLRLKKTQAKPASLKPPKRLQDISWQDFMRSLAPSGASSQTLVVKVGFAWIESPLYGESNSGLGWSRPAL